MLNEKIAELDGMHVGDGTLYPTKTSLVWEQRGDLLEKEYYLDIVAPLLYSIFKIEFKPKFRSGGKNGCFGIQTSKKEVTSFFLSQGFKAGRKTDIVRVPDKIKVSTEEIKLAFLRGYFDTDGCLRFERKNKKKVKDYPKIEMGSSSEGLILDLADLFTELNFRFYTWLDKRTTTFKICIAGKEMLEKWINEVKPNNPKHLNKYQIFRRLGYYPDAAIA